MSLIQNHNNAQDKNDSAPLAETGNASNPSPRPNDLEPTVSNQILSEGAEKYLRESGNIEDMPDAQDQQDMDEVIKKENSD